MIKNLLSKFENKMMLIVVSVYGENWFIVFYVSVLLGCFYFFVSSKMSVVILLI